MDNFDGIYPAKSFFRPDEDIMVMESTNYTRDFPADKSNLHTREFWKITYIIHGSGTFRINGHLFDLVPGFLYLVHPLDSITYHLASDILHYNVLFRTSIINELLSSLDCSRGFFSIFHKKEHPENEPDHVHRHLLDASKNVYAIISRMHTEYLRQSADSQKMLKAILTELLITLSRRSERAFPRKRHSSAIDELKRYLELNFRNPFDYDLIADKMGISKKYMGDFYKKGTGSTINETLASLRLAEARHLLSEDRHSIKDICFFCGFSDISNFYHLFKKRYGMSPGTFRDAFGITANYDKYTARGGFKKSH